MDHWSQYISYITRKPCCRRETTRWRCNFPRCRPAATLDLIEPEIAPFDPPTADPENPILEPNIKWIESPVAQIWPFDYSKNSAGRHLEFNRTGNSAIRSAYPENPTLEQNMKWIG